MCSRYYVFRYPLVKSCIFYDGVLKVHVQYGGRMHIQDMQEIVCGLFSSSIVSFIMIMSALTELTFISGLFLIIAQMFFLINLLCFLVLDENGEESEEPPVPVVWKRSRRKMPSTPKSTQHPITQSLNKHIIYFSCILYFKMIFPQVVSCFIRRMESLRRRGSEHCIWRWWLRANFSF